MYTGVPIRVHITLCIVVPFLMLSLVPTFTSRPLLWCFLAALGFVVSVAIHEWGHGLAGSVLKCRVREILLLPMGGVTLFRHPPRAPKDQIMIAMAGPVASLLMTVCFGVLCVVASAVALPSMGRFFITLSYINLMLALFNLIPTFPMDGGTIFRAWMSSKVGVLEGTRLGIRIGQTIAIFLGFWSLIRLNPFGLAIAFFIYFSAKAEARVLGVQGVEVQSPRERLKRPYSGEPFSLNDEIVVGPPPYKKDEPRPSPSTFQRVLSIFERLFKENR